MAVLKTWEQTIGNVIKMHDRVDYAFEQKTVGATDLVVGDLVTEAVEGVIELADGIAEAVGVVARGGVTGVTDCIVLYRGNAIVAEEGLNLGASTLAKARTDLGLKDMIIKKSQPNYDFTA